MSLQIWLPLQGDLHNQGLSSITIKENEQTSIVDSNGKFGKCYSFSNGQRIGFNIDPTHWNSSQVSMSCWIYPTEWTFTYTPPLTLSTTSSWKNTIGFCTSLTETNDKIYFIVSDGDNYKSVSISTTLLPLNTWSIITGTFDGNVLKIYINGIEKNSITLSSQFPIVWPNAGGVGARSISPATSYFTGKVNDVRIYDHCLSPKEVEEIAKGLVLHYKLDDGYVEGTTNLLSATRSYPEETDIPFSSTSTSQGVYWSYNITNPMYTLSAYINNTSNQSIRVVLSTKRASDNEVHNVANGNYIAPGEKGWSKCTYTIPSTEVENYIRVGLQASAAQNTVTPLPKVQFFQLEAKDHQTPWTLGGTTRTPTTVYDSSGYSHNGTITGSLTAAAGSPRYDVATVFDATNGRFDFDHFTDADALTNEFTFSGWIYRNYTDATTRYIYYGLCEIYLYTDFKPRITWNHASADLSYNTQNSWASGVVIPLQEWTHLVFTFKDGVLYYYINGVQYGPSDRSGTGTFMRGTRGTPNGHIGWSWIGNLSDIRTYATALTEDQVKELYNTSMSVDSNGNIHARELVEL